MVRSIRNGRDLGPQASDEDSVEYAEANALAILFTDHADFSEFTSTVPMVIGPMT